MVLLACNIDQPTEPNAWNNKAYSISIFGFMKFLEIDSKNMFISLYYIVDYIRSRKVKKGLINGISELKSFGKAAWSFVSSIYESG